MLKVQSAIWHEKANKVEALLGASPLSEVATQIYGAVLTDVQVNKKSFPASVLLAARVKHTFKSWCDVLVQSPLDVGWLKALLDLVADFFSVVARGAVALGFALKDLHWGNLGITGGDRAVVLIDIEGCEQLNVDPAAMPKAKCGAVKLWLKDFREFIDEKRQSDWGPTLSGVYDAVYAFWWRVYPTCLSDLH